MKVISYVTTKGSRKWYFMFVAKYTITQDILKNVALATSAKDLVSFLPISQSWHLKLKRQAVERSIYYNLRIAGSNLSLESVQEAIDGKAEGVLESELQEIRNYQALLNFTEVFAREQGQSSGYLLTLETICQLHAILSSDKMPTELLGKFRQKQLVIKDSKTTQVVYSPPPSVEVPYLLEDLINWINSEVGRATHPTIRAAIAVCEMERIHPFTFDNDSIARSLGLLLLNLDGWDLTSLVCLEEFFDNNLLQYHQLLQSTFNQKVIDSHERDLTVWIEYYTQAVCWEFNQIAASVKRLSAASHIKDQLGDQLELNERQMLIMEYLNRHKQMKNSDFRKIFPDFSDDTVLREVRFLRKKGLVKKEGGTKNAVYVTCQTD